MSSTSVYRLFAICNIVACESIRFSFALRRWGRFAKRPQRRRAKEKRMLSQATMLHIANSLYTDVDDILHIATMLHIAKTYCKDLFPKTGRCKVSCNLGGQSRDMPFVHKSWKTNSQYRHFQHSEDWIIPSDSVEGSFHYKFFLRGKFCLRYSMMLFLTIINKLSKRSFYWNRAAARSET